MRNPVPIEKQMRLVYRQISDAFRINRAAELSASASAESETRLDTCTTSTWFANHLRTARSQIPPRIKKVRGVVGSCIGGIGDALPDMIAYG